MTPVMPVTSGRLWNEPPNLQSHTFNAPAEKSAGIFLSNHVTFSFLPTHIGGERGELLWTQKRLVHAFNYTGCEQS